MSAALEGSRYVIRDDAGEAIGGYELLYHVPRSQVWQGSRGGQSGAVHLHVLERFEHGRIVRERGRALCGRRGWYERPAEGETATCGRCAEIAARVGVDACLLVVQAADDRRRRLEDARAAL